MSNPFIHSPHSPGRRGGGSLDSVETEMNQLIRNPGIAFAVFVQLANGSMIDCIGVDPILGQIDSILSYVMRIEKTRNSMPRCNTVPFS